MFIDYYDLLEIPHYATDAQIKAAIKLQSFKWHPDKNPGINTNARMQLINEARKILSDPALKANYDIEYHQYHKLSANDSNDSSEYEPWEPYEYKNSTIDDKNLKELYENMILEKTDAELLNIIRSVYDYDEGYVSLVVNELILRNFDPEKIDSIIFSQQRPPVKEEVQTSMNFNPSWLWMYLLFCLAGFLSRGTH